jgi:hypothetical protein
MKKNRPFPAYFFCLLAFLSIIQHVQAQPLSCKNSICFESPLKISGHEVPIRGIALLEYLRFDLYTAALYAAPEIKTIDTVLGNTPKSLVLHYHRTIKKEVMIKASRDRILKNSAIDSKALEDRLKQLDAAYQNVKKGDRYELRYEPNVGTSLILNGKLQATIQGEDFQKAFFGIWLSRVPLNKKLRDALLQSPQK